MFIKYLLSVCEVLLLFLGYLLSHCFSQYLLDASSLPVRVLDPEKTNMPLGFFLNDYESFPYNSFFFLQDNIF